MLKQYEIKLTNAWFDNKPSLCLLRPFSMLYRLICVLRRVWYKIFSPKALDVPVIVVGNITVGGSGKTPVVIALCQILNQMGFKPGIISRGYKSSLNQRATQVESFHTPSQVGDEPLLMHFKVGVPVVIGKNRLKAAQYLLEHNPQVDILLSDDGLQHYRLPRTKEIAMCCPNAWGNQ